MPYGSVTDGVWRSKFKVEWRRYLRAHPTVALAQRSFQRSLIGRVKNKISDEWTLKPFLTLDKYLVHPTLTHSERLLDQFLKTCQRANFIDAAALRSKLGSDTAAHRKSHALLPRLSLNLASSERSEGSERSDAQRSEDDQRILSLVAQAGGLRTTIRSFLWRLKFLRLPIVTWSVVHAGLARRVYARLGVRNFSLADVVEFVHDDFIPKFLACVNAHEFESNKSWLAQHAATHVVSLMQGFKSVSAELYGEGHVDNILYQTQPLSVVYNSAYVKPDIARDPKKPITSLNQLPSVICEVVLRSFSENPDDSPVTSGPKTITLIMAVCLLPNAHPKDAWPLYVRRIIFQISSSQIQDAMMTGIDQLKV